MLFAFVGVCTSLFDDRNCFGKITSSELEEPVRSESCSFSLAFLARALASSPGMPRISAHWSGGGVGCFRDSSSVLCGQTDGCSCNFYVMLSVQGKFILI